MSDPDIEARAYLQDLASAAGVRVTAEQVGELVALTRPASFDAGDIVFRQGQPANFALLVIKGRIRATVRTPAGEQTVNEIGPGEIVGEAALVKGGVRSATVSAIDNSTCLALSRATLAAAAANPALVMLETKLLALLAERVSRTARRVQKSRSDVATHGREDADVLGLLRSE